jgi:hypothetical protein
MSVDARFTNMDRKDVVNAGVTANGVYNAVKAAFSDINSGTLNNAFTVSTLQNAYRESFPNTTLDTSKWVVVQTGAGMTISVNNGLTIAAGTGINSETILESIDSFTISHRIMFGFQPSQKIANQECYLELVSVNSDNIVDNKDASAWVWENAIATTAATMVYKVQTDGDGTLANLYASGNYAVSTSNTLGITMTSGGILEQEITPDELWFHAKNIDSISGRTYSFVKHKQVLNPKKRYKLRLRVKNLGNAPASDTNFVFPFISVTDFTELMTEITGGCGSQSAGQGVPVLVQGIGSDGTTDSGAPVYMGVKATNGVVTNAGGNGNKKALLGTLNGVLLNKPYAVPELDLSFACSAAIANTTAVDFFTASGASVRNYLTGFQYINTNATATELQIIDDNAGTPVILWRGYAPASMVTPVNVTFTNPLKSTANKVLSVKCATTGASVYFNAQGYKAP